MSALTNAVNASPVISCLASTWHLISASNTTDHLTKLTNLAHFGRMLSNEHVWNEAKTAAKAEIEQAPFNTTAQERADLNSKTRTIDQLLPERGLRSFRNMIEIGRALDPLIDPWDQLEAEKNFSHIDDEDVVHLRKWFDQHREWHRSQVPINVLEHLTQAYVLFRWAGTMSIAEQASIVMLARSIWDESGWKECLEKAGGGMPPRKSNVRDAEETCMEQAMDVMRRTKAVLEQVSKDWANALDWVK